MRSLAVSRGMGLTATSDTSQKSRMRSMSSAGSVSKGAGGGMRMGKRGNAGIAWGIYGGHRGRTSVRVLGASQKPPK